MRLASDSEGSTLGVAMPYMKLLCWPISVMANIGQE